MSEYKPNPFMIHDISEILNFRYFKGYLSRRWDGGQFHESFLDYKKVLKEPPVVYGDFKYAIHKDLGIQINNQSKNNNVFCNTPDQRFLVDLTNKYPDNFDNLIIMGSDKHLSACLRFLTRIRHRFKKIYYEAKDVECDWVRTLPMSMIMAYMIRNGGNDILKHFNKQKNKTKLVASAFGSRWPELTNKLGNRSSLETFTKDSDFVDDMFCDPLVYFERLCEYKFFLAPLGNGIQTPKICECIMCETIPVVTDHVTHRELRDIYGLPLLIVDEWTDITEEFLNEQWDSVYSKVNWNNQKSKFLVKNFNKLLI